MNAYASHSIILRLLHELVTRGFHFRKLKWKPPSFQVFVPDLEFMISPNTDWDYWDAQIYLCVQVFGESVHSFTDKIYLNYFLIH